LVYATYLGGTADEFGGGIAVDDGGHAYVTGWTESLDFPTTVGAFQPAHGGSFSDGFVTKLHRRGTGLIFSTYLGGSGSVDGWGEYGTDIGLDSARNVYVTGQTDSADFPITPDAFQTANAGGTSDAFVTKLHRSGAMLMFSTYLGGSGDDVALGLAVDENRDAYVAGYTSSLDLPTTSGAFQAVNGGGAYDAFVAKVRP
jgi:hypothetical protein